MARRKSLYSSVQISRKEQQSLSFFDEVEDPRPASGVDAGRARRSTRSGGGGRPPRRPTDRRPPSHSKQVQTRRLIAVAAIIVVVVVAALLIHGCDVSETNSSLQSYAGEVSSSIGNSDRNGTQMFAYLSRGDSAASAGTLQEHLDGVLTTARAQLHAVQALHAPSQMSAAQQALVQTMRLRYLGIRKIAGQVQGASDPRTSRDAVRAIAVGMYMLVGSDVDYKTLAAPAIVAALRRAKLAVGGANGVPINGGQIVGDLGWLEPREIAARLGAHVPVTVANGPCASVCGHNLNYVTFAGQQLSSSTASTITPGTKPTFALNFTNGGSSNEYDVGCEVWIKGLRDRGHSTFPETRPGGSYECDVTLPSAPPAGTYTIYAKIERVRGEKNMSNNVQSYTVTVS